MNKTFTFFALLFLCSFFTKANTVIISGQLKYGNGNPVAGWAVYISPDSTATTITCQQTHLRYTNANGYYYDTLTCSSTISQLQIRTSNGCGIMLYNTPTVPASNVVVSNFTLCTPAATCHADFSFTGSGFITAFTSLSTPASGGSIISYKWNFGDGSPDVVYTSAYTNHGYSAPGAYVVKHMIETNNGCKDTIIKAVVIAPTGSCHAAFTDSVAGNNVYLNSSTSTTAANDSVKTRFWTYNSNTVSSGTANTIITFPASGTYNICLKIVTWGGCADSICKTVMVTVPPTCQATYTYSTIGHTAFFNSSGSTAAPGDSIIERKWNFGDGSPVLSGNVINPVHTYAYDTSHYHNACLTIKTVSGCTKTFCRYFSFPQDSSAIPGETLVITNIYPNPAIIVLNTLVWSSVNNTPATYAIYDLFGTLKWSGTNTLYSGNNFYAIPVQTLLAGPYILKVTTAGATKSKPFFKL